MRRKGEILGETMPLKGYAFSLDGQDLGKIYELLGEEIPGYGQVMDLWLGLMSTSLTASGYTLETAAISSPLATCSRAWASRWKASSGWTRTSATPRWTW